MSLYISIAHKRAGVCSSLLSSTDRCLKQVYSPLMLPTIPSPSINVHVARQLDIYVCDNRLPTASPSSRIVCLAQSQLQAQGHLLTGVRPLHCTTQLNESCICPASGAASKPQAQRRSKRLHGINRVSLVVRKASHPRRQLPPESLDVQSVDT